MIRMHYQVGNGYNSSPQIVTYILQKAFFKHVLKRGVFLLEKDKYYKKAQLLPGNYVINLCVLFFLQIFRYNSAILRYNGLF